MDTKSLIRQTRRNLAKKKSEQIRKSITDRISSLYKMVSQILTLSEKTLQVAEETKKMEGPAGKDGYTPQRGKDYFTEEEILSFIEQVTPKKGVDYKDGEVGKDGARGSVFIGSYKSIKELPSEDKYRVGDWAYIEDSGEIWYIG